MRKIFAWIAPTVGFGDEIVRRVVYWTAFFGLVSAAMSWVAAHITPISHYGWGAVVFAGVGAACAITLVVSGALVAWRYFNPLPEQSATNEGPNAPMGRNTLDRNIFKEKFVYGGSAPSVGRSLVLPSFQATFDIHSENVRIFIDEIYFLPLPGPPVNWTPQNHLLLKEIPRVSRDETISIRLLSQFDCGDQKLWRWGEDGAAEGQYVFLTDSTYQGRVRVVSAGQQECCYFIVIGMVSDEGPPRVIGEHMFNFPAATSKSDWERRLGDPLSNWRK